MGGVSPGRARPEPESRSRGPAAAPGGELSGGRPQVLGEAAHGAARTTRRLGRFCPSCSFSACQDCSTLSVLPRKRLSIHLAARGAGSATAGAEEREERRSGGIPSAPPASGARSARPSPAALLGTAVLTSPHPHPAPGGGAAQRVGCGERGRGSVSACVCPRTCASPARGRSEPQLDPVTSQKPSSLQTGAEGRP